MCLLIGYFLESSLHPSYAPAGAPADVHHPAGVYRALGDARTGSRTAAAGSAVSSDLVSEATNNASSELLMADVLRVTYYDYAADGTLVHVDAAGRLHRLDGPAMDSPYGREWAVHGRTHRLDGPAVEGADGSYEWRRDGQPHREGGPAIKRHDGTLEWWLDGVPHRDDGPAYLAPDGSRAWYRHGQPERGAPTPT